MKADSGTMLNRMIRNFNCRRYAPLLTAYVEGGLDSRRQNQIASHLTNCPSCREQVQELTDLGNLLRAHPPAVPTLSPDLWSRIQAEITVDMPTPVPASREPVRARPGGFHWANFGLSFAGAGTVMAVVVAGVVFLFPMKRHVTPPVSLAARPVTEQPGVSLPGDRDAVNIEIRPPIAVKMPAPSTPAMLVAAPAQKDKSRFAPPVASLRRYRRVVRIASLRPVEIQRKQINSQEESLTSGQVLGLDMMPKEATADAAPIMDTSERPGALPPGRFQLASANEDAGVAPRSVSASPDAALRLRRQQILFSYSGQ